MEHRNHRQPPLSLRAATRRAAAGTALAVGLPALLAASGTRAAEETFVLDTLTVEERTADTNPYAEKGAPYKAKFSGDRRRRAEIADVPQTLVVTTQTLIQEAGKQDLKEVLDGLAGITLGTGENGNAFGDRYIIRGHEARSDVFVDGLRDPGMTIRESFAVEQIEVTKGPSATFAGRGSTGGAINAITKQASTEYDFAKLSGGLGTDAYQRYTLDANKRLGDHLAVRANLLWADEEVPDRDPASRRREGLALSGQWHTTERLEWIADLYWLNAEDRPDLGGYIDTARGEPVYDVPVYLQKQDFLESEVGVATLTTRFAFAPNLTLENKLRYGETDNGYVLTSARGSSRAPSDPEAPGVPTLVAGSHQGWQEVSYWVDQLNLYWDATLAGLTHKLVLSAEYSDLQVKNGNFLVTNSGERNCVVAGRGGASPGYCFLDGAGRAVADIHRLLGRQIARGPWDSDWRVETWSLGLMETVDLNRWVSLFFGVRADDFDYHNDVVGPGATAPTPYAYSDTLWNGLAGLVFHLTDNGNLYFTASSATNINGGESDVGGNCGYGGICGSLELIGRSKPAKAENLEIGTKWEFFDDRLLASAALFRITKDDVMEGADYGTTGSLNTGKNRVEGIEVELAGNLGERLAVFLNASLMDSEVLDSAYPERIGGKLANFAEESAYLQVRYQATPKLALGSVLTYQGEIHTGQPDAAANESWAVPDYAVWDLFASYRFNPRLEVRLNVNNVTDEEYFLTAYRSGAMAYLGDARQVYMTVNYEL